MYRGQILSGQKIKSLMHPEEILAIYPQIKRLFWYDPKFKWIVMATVLTQLLILYLVKNWSWYTVLGLAYCFGGVINHSLM